MTDFYLNQNQIYSCEQDIPIGTVYTSGPVAKQLVFLGLRDYLRIHMPNQMDHFIDFYKKSYLENTTQALESSLYNRILDISVLDLCCGSGNLLIAYIEWVIFMTINLKLPIDGLQMWLKNKIHANDIDFLGLEAYANQLKKLLSMHHVMLDDACINLSNVDALQSQLRFDQNTFDLILGNPPYIGEKGNTIFFQSLKETAFGKQFYEGKMDYFYFFIYKSYELLKPEGVLCYITTQYFLTANGAKKMRTFMKEKFHLTQWLDYNDTKPFENKKLHASAYTLSKIEPKHVTVFNALLEEEASIPYQAIYKKDNVMYLIVHENVREQLQKMSTNALCTLNDFYKISQGIVSGMDRNEGNGVFVYKEDEIDNLPKEIHGMLRPFYKNSAIDHYRFDETVKHWIIYSNISAPPESLLEQLKPFQNELCLRREVMNGVRLWFELTWPREQSLFIGEKIVVPQRAKANYFAYTTLDFYASADVYFIKSKPDSPYDLRIMTLMLNSSPYLTWLEHMGKRKGQLLELYATPLKNIPIPVLSTLHIDQMRSFAHKVWTDNLDLTVEDIEKIDNIVSEAFGLE